MEYVRNIIFQNILYVGNTYFYLTRVYVWYMQVNHRSRELDVLSGGER